MMRSATERKQEQRGEETLASHMGYGMAIVASIAALVFLASWYGLLLPWQRIGLDTLLRARHYRSQDTVIVEITDDDYKNIFKSKSPLDPKNVEQLVLGVAAGEPRVIVVDLDTTDPRDQVDGKPLETDLQEKLDRRWKSYSLDPRQAPQPNLIWPEIPKRAPYGGGKPEIWDAQGHLGGNFGLPLFAVETNGSVRTLSPELLVQAEGGCKLWPTLPQVALTAYEHAIVTPRDAACEGSEEPEPLILKLSRDRYTFTHLDATSVLADQSSPPASVPAAHLLPVFRGKIAVIGGTYAAARDEYQTAVGPLPGVDLLAFGIETLKDRALRPIQEGTAVLVDLALGCAILMISFHFHRSAGLAILSSVLTAVIAPILLSYLVFRSGNYWMSFLPVIAGAFLHIAYDCVKDLHRKEKEVKSLRTELQELKARCEVAEPPTLVATVNVTTVIAEQGHSAGG